LLFTPSQNFLFQNSMSPKQKKLENCFSVEKVFIVRMGAQLQCIIHICTRITTAILCDILSMMVDVHYDYTNYWKCIWKLVGCKLTNIQGHYNWGIMFWCFMKSLFLGSFSTMSKNVRTSFAVNFLSVRPHVTTWKNAELIFMKICDFWGGFIKVCWHIPILIKIEQKKRVLREDLHVFLCATRS
jgi:hypothetical protein